MCDADLDLKLLFEIFSFGFPRVWSFKDESSFYVHSGVIVRAESSQQLR